MPLSADDLRFNSPSLDEQVLRRAAKDLFGIDGEFLPLVGERDQNTLVTTAEGEKYVLKVSGALEDPLITELQTRALLHIEQAAPDLPVPRIVRNRSGLPSDLLIGAGDQRHVVRLLTYLPGITFDDASAIAGEDLRAIGAFQGRVCLALASFQHPVARHFTPWDVSNGLLASDELWAYAAEDTLEIAEAARMHLAKDVLPAMTRLRTQIIHGDAHTGNLLRPSATSHCVIGLIDFGDMVEAPLAVDLAVVAAGFSNVNDDLLSTAVSLTRGFNEVVPLSSDEVGQLYDLILARHVLSALLFDFQIATGSGATEDVLQERPSGLLALRQWLQLDASELIARLDRTQPDAAPRRPE
jgi:Ser/Thr protein kinase RdoA (MazF antagonist)